MEDQILVEVPRVDGETVVRIVRREYKGKVWMDYRLWYRDGKSERFVPTRKGFFLNKEEAEIFAAGIIVNAVQS